MYTIAATATPLDLALAGAISAPHDSDSDHEEAAPAPGGAGPAVGAVAGASGSAVGAAGAAGAAAKKTVQPVVPPEAVVPRLIGDATAGTATTEGAPSCPTKRLREAVAAGADASALLGLPEGPAPMVRRRRLPGQGPGSAVVAPPATEAGSRGLDLHR